MARNGMVATSQPLAAQAGLDILKKGGNAIDAAVATAAVLSVVEPMNVGPGGDLFAIIYIAKENKLYALNASGKAPSGADARAHERARLPRGIRRTGARARACRAAASSPSPCPAPCGAGTRCCAASARMTFKETLQPAIDYAEQGFPGLRAHRLRLAAAQGLRPAPCDPRAAARELDPDSVATWYIERQAAGRRARSSAIPGLAQDVPPAAAAGPRRLLQGRDRAAPSSPSRRALGGTMTLEDLAAYAGEWVDAGDHQLSRLRRVRRCRRRRRPGPPTRCSTSSRRACRSGRRARRWRRSVRRARNTGTSSSRRRSSPSRISTPTTPIRISRRCRSIGCCRRRTPQSLCGTVDPTARLGARRRQPRRQRRRHHRALHRRSRRQHGGVGQQPLLGLRLRAHRAGLRLHAAQPRRPVHARSEEPQRDRAAQAAVQHAVGRLRDAATTSR